MKKNNFETIKLEKGEMHVYDFGAVKLHAYKTNDFLEDEVYVVEKNGNVVVIESPCFFDNCKELEKYVCSLNANVCGVLVSYHAADAVISFDRLLFRMEKNVVVFAEGFVVGGVDVEITGVVRGYLPGRDNPLATVYVQDSVFWSESADNMEQLKLYLPSPDEALRAAGQYIGTKITPNFVPHWDNESRWFYKGEGARWKEATAYALSDKWEEAALRWKHVYENSSRWKERAKAASNLALYYEMKTQLKEAYNWAAKSYEIFNSKKGEDYNYTKMQRLYVEALGKRIRSDQKLNKQFGE